MPNIMIPVTLLYGGLCALLVTALGANISRLRGKHKAYVGAQLPTELLRAVRAHGNAAEYVGIGIVLLLILELSGVSTMALHVLGGGFLFARVLHAFGLMTKSPVTAVAAGINYLTLSTMSIWAVVQHFTK